MPVREEGITDAGNDRVHHEQNFAVREPSRNITVAVGGAGIQQFKISPVKLVSLALTVPDFRSRQLTVRPARGHHIGAQPVGNNVRLWRQICGKPGMVEVVMRINDGVDWLLRKHPADGPGVGAGGARRGQGIKGNDAAVAFEEDGTVNALAHRPDFVAHRAVGNVSPRAHDGMRRGNGKNTAVITLRMAGAAAVFHFAHCSLPPLWAF